MSTPEPTTEQHQRDRVFVDTATLYPISVADLVLRLAELGLFDLIWSDDLLAEVTRVLVEYKGLAPDSANYFCDCIREAFPDGRIEPGDYLHLVASRQGPDPQDHVHSAAAVAGRATIVLSADRKGYPRRDIAPARRESPDAYLTELLRENPTEVLGVVDEMGTSLRQPRSRLDVVGSLRRAGLVDFADLATKLS